MIEFTVPLPRQGIQFLNSMKNAGDSKEAQWALRESVLDAAQRHQGWSEPYERVELRLTSRSVAHGRSDGRYRAASPWSVALFTPYVVHGLFAAGLIDSVKDYVLVCAVEPVDSLADEGIHVRVSAVRPIEEEAE